MLTLKNQIIQEQIVTFANTYPFILIFHSNTVTAKQWIAFRKTLYLKNIKAPCKNLPIRFFSKKYSFESLDSRVPSSLFDSTSSSRSLVHVVNNEHVKNHEQRTSSHSEQNKGSDTISNKFLTNVGSLGGPSCFFFCQTTKEVQEILNIMKELNEVRILPYFLNVGMLLSEDRIKGGIIPCSPVSFHEVEKNQPVHPFAKQTSSPVIVPYSLRELANRANIEQNKRKQLNYKFLSFYDIEAFIKLNASIYSTVISLLIKNNKIHFDIDHFFYKNNQLLLLNQIILLKLVQYSYLRNK